MKIFWRNNHKRSEILDAIEKDDAVRLGDVGPESDIFIGSNHIFVNPSDYDIDGYSLTINDLRIMLRMLEAPIICDGCNVRPPFEHRCHGNRSVIAGKHTGQTCECKDCHLAAESSLRVSLAD
jgi:hypothetical protein